MLKDKNEILQLALDIAKILDNKKAVDVKILKIDEKTVIADYFVIAGGTSTTMVNSLADEVEYKIGEEKGIKPANIEGRGLGNWVLLDYENVIVHIFNPQSRDFYNLEKLWAEGTEIEFEKTQE
jgi:ribosome-associated protein